MGQLREPTKSKLTEFIATTIYLATASYFKKPLLNGFRPTTKSSSCCPPEQVHPNLCWLFFLLPLSWGPRIWNQPLSLRGSETNLKLFWLSFSSCILCQTLAASVESALGTIVVLVWIPFLRGCSEGNHHHRLAYSILFPSFNVVHDFLVKL